MPWRRTSIEGDPPHDPLGDGIAEALAEIVGAASVELAYRPSGTATGAAEREAQQAPGGSAAAGAGPPGWELAILVRLDERLASLTRDHERNTLGELLGRLTAAGARVERRLRMQAPQHDQATPALRRALRDIVATELLSGYLQDRVGGGPHTDLVAETIEYMIELSGSRVEAHDLTHGVVVADVFPDTPRLSVRYPRDVRRAKRAPLLFDGQRSVLVVDPEGRARTELQRHRLGRLSPGPDRTTSPDDGAPASGSLVAEVTRVVGGVGFFVRADRTIWSFVDGQPLLVRRAEHWTAFPLELTSSIANMIGGGAVAGLVARTAFVISAQPRGAILAIVDDPDRLEGIVSLKDRFDLRGEHDPTAMRAETRLHHLIDVTTLDESTLARLAALDGATVLDRDGRLIAYGAVVTTSDSEHEGARTAAARTLSETAEVVLKVSVDGDITIFRGGRALTTLLGVPSQR